MGRRGRPRLLHLQEQRVRAIAAQHQGDPAAGPHAADPDHLAGDVRHLELLQQIASVGSQRPPAPGDQGRELGLQVRPVGSRHLRGTVSRKGVSPARVGMQLAREAPARAREGCRLGRHRA